LIDQSIRKVSYARDEQDFEVGDSRPIDGALQVFASKRFERRLEAAFEKT